MATPPANRARVGNAMTECGGRRGIVFEGLSPVGLNDCPARDCNSADKRDIDAIMETVDAHQTGMVWRIRCATETSRATARRLPR